MLHVFSFPVFPIEYDVFPRNNSYNCVEQIARRAIIMWRNKEISQSRDKGQVTIAAAYIPSRVTAIVKSLLINARIEPTPKSSFMRILRTNCVQQYPFHDTRTRVIP